MVISLLMCGYTATLITYLYSIIRLLLGLYPYNNPYCYYYVEFLIIAIATFFHLCSSASHFSRHMQHVSSQLRDLRLTVRDEENKLQLHYLISTLEKMETFDMGSWYNLGPNTLVSVTTFVVTHLVVLLQVGNLTTNGALWNEANTTAV